LKEKKKILYLNLLNDMCFSIVSFKHEYKTKLVRVEKRRTEYFYKITLTKSILLIHKKKEKKKEKECVCITQFMLQPWTANCSHINVIKY